MFKKFGFLLALLLGLGHAAVSSLTLPLDWTGASGISRANLNLNPIALRDAHNTVVDSLNAVMAALTGFSNSVSLASNQDLILKVDVDANGTQKFVVTGNNTDSLFRIQEGSTARLFNGLTVDSALTVGNALTFANAKSSAPVAGSIWKYTTGGLALRAVAGSTWDFEVMAPGFTAILGVPTGTFNVQIPAGSLTVLNSITGGSFSTTGSATVDTLICAKCNDENSFTVTPTGCTTTPSLTIKYVRIGKTVTMIIPNSGTLTSNASTFGYSGLPVALAPTTTQTCVAYSTTDNGVSTQAGAQIQFSASTTISFLKAGGGASSWTSSGNKQMFSVNCSYILQ